NSPLDFIFIKCNFRRRTNGAAGNGRNVIWMSKAGSGSTRLISYRPANSPLPFNTIYSRLAADNEFGVARQI
ncbi:MAG TPA: hypothetical protein VLN44_06725, partial [Pyrinomonadaceae bacterium]|nr:hypothetical protein [Pyrinomonadaceae bacterium]